MEDRLEIAESYASSQLERAKGEITALPQPLQTVLAVFSAQGVIDNGGLVYFFEADFPGSPPYSFFVEAYDRIGATREAEALAAAVRLFPFEEPHHKRTERLDWMGENALQLEAHDGVLCGSQAVYPALKRYVERYAEFFPGDKE